MVERGGNSRENEQLISALMQRATDLRVSNNYTIPSAVAIAMMEEGERKLKEIPSQTEEFGGVALAPDSNDFFGSIPPARRNDAIKAVMLILTGSLSFALDQAIVDKWDDDIFISNFNFKVTGTPIPKIGIAAQLRNLNSEIETADIKQISIFDTKSDLDIFFRNIERLPSVFRGIYNKLPELSKIEFRNITGIFSQTTRSLGGGGDTGNIEHPENTGGPETKIPDEFYR